ASEVAARDLMRLDVYKAVSMGLAMVDNIRGADFQARGLVLALKAGERQRVGRSIALEAIYQATGGVPHEARAEKLYKEAQSIAEADGSAYLLAWAMGAEGIAAYLCGHFKRGAEQILEAEGIFRERTIGTACEISNARVLRLIALRATGAYRELRQDFDFYLRDAARRGDRFTETTLTRACNVLWLVDGRPDQARRELEQKSWTPPEGGYHMQHWYELRARAEISLYEGTALTGFDEGFA